jgi:murein DD-endopeptidase MepM/ murein hydrolase activator NlpD
MPNSTARRAHRHFALATGLGIVIGLGFVLLPAASQAADVTPAPAENAGALVGPPQQITAPFSEKDNFIERLRRQGVADNEARSIDKAIRSALTPAQRKSGALIQINFGGETWPWVLQSISIEPLNGASLTLARNAVVPGRPGTVQAAKATQDAPPPAPPSVQVPQQPAAIKIGTPAPVAAKAAKTSGTTSYVDPFGDVASNAKLLPASGASDPEWPVQPPKTNTAKAGGQTMAIVHGTLGPDVAHSLSSAGVPTRIATEISQAVTLHPPLHNASLTGSRFDIAYEPLPDASVGFIVAEFAVNGGRQRIWRYRPDGGVPGFYTDDGRRIGGLAIQSPVPGAPIVSPYGMRKHPVLHVNKMHWGVDYAANTGTPILAAADGTVEDVRRLGNYGLYIRLSHSEGVETTYGHMSQFAQGLKAGDPVKAGEVIGYAGRSGLASGPHLYFEVFVEGKRVDPEPMVSDQPLRLNGTDLAQFETLKQRATAVQTAAQQ